ncbi:myo-inositol-1(or 4)-monophosphatase [Loktanella ponticola]|uniref:Myo-inositol-1(Or 4)-monophosphatase n=1 Tax=Yoonia ponticola TaxID=1524255 RepID=A0A7W9BHP0_9RHOB|nr:3'(2'),5'-bisphosphate nucleotidase CysQ [Yoonia ponticola]MBB5720452.1 myo-inositol-1(or 4)-monophosphatase [Yoonia ponticola]
MQGTDLDLLIATAKASGEIARGFVDVAPKVWEKGGGAGPVTEADLAVNELMASDLQTARPDYGWLSEETEDDMARLERQRQFIVDPIDGTRAFIDGSRDWAHALAVLEDGLVTCAVVYLPMRDLMYTASHGGGAFLNGEPIKVSQKTDLDGATVLSNKASFADEIWAAGAPPIGVTRKFRSSLAYRLSLAAQGRFDAMMIIRPSWEWDIAAGALIVAEAGGDVTDQTGAPLRFNNPHPQVNGVVAGSPITSKLRDAFATSTVEARLPNT